MLMALKARAKILSLTGERTVPVEDLYTGNGIQPLGLLPDELLAEIFIPRPEPKGGAAYLRYSLRKAVDFPMVSAGVSLVKRNGICTEARIVLGAVAPRPLRLAEAETALRGKADHRIAPKGLRPGSSAGSAADFKVRANRSLYPRDDNQPGISGIEKSLAGRRFVLRRRNDG